MIEFLVTKFQLGIKMTESILIIKKMSLAGILRFSHWDSATKDSTI